MDARSSQDIDWNKEREYIAHGGPEPLKRVASTGESKQSLLLLL